MIDNIRTVQLDTNGDGTIDCVGYFWMQARGIPLIITVS